MACPDKVLADVEWCATQESKKSGFNSQLAIALFSDITTWPTFGGAAVAPETAYEAAQKATGTFTMVATKKFAKLPAIFQEVDLNIKQEGNAFISELTVRIQNTTHNRGFIEEMTGCYLAVVAKPMDEPAGLLFGSQRNGQSFPAKIRPGSVTVKQPKEYSSTERYIEFIIEYTPYMPAVFSGTTPFV